MMIRVFKFVNFIFVFYYITYFHDFLVDATGCGIERNRAENTIHWVDKCFLEKDNSSDAGNSEEAKDAARSTSSLPGIPKCPGTQTKETETSAEESWDKMEQITSFIINEACHKTDPNKLNVHLVPHTHDDVGWLKTVDQYYYGSNKGHAPFGVQYILDSVISELLKNENRRFVFVETAYFWRWWEEIQDNERNMVKMLVSNGRLEFLHGGWCMSDEATPHYSAMIDQMTLGLKFLNETFGECGRPSASWQIDPFGHSSEVAIEFAQMAFDSLFLGRIDYEDHTARKLYQHMEMVWRPDPSLGEAGNLFTSVLFDLYTAPAGFCFDTYCSDEPIMDNKKLHGYNIVDKIKKFKDHLERYKLAYKTNHVLVTMGGDFTYSVASSWFKNIDKLIKYTNVNSSSLNLIYSTPNCYIHALNALNLTWPAKEDDDFFPYASDEHSYWTGYFTSRVTLKDLVYRTNTLLQGAKQLANLLEDRYLEDEFCFKRAVAIAQHHDGVSGTEKQHVADDYATYLQEGLNAGLTIFNQAFGKIYDSNYPTHRFCILTNISQCSTSEDDGNFVITLYNPLSRKTSLHIRFPVKNNTQHQIFYQNGSSINYDLIPIPESVTKMPGRKSNATHEIVFASEKISALSTINYYVEVTLSENATFVNNSQSSESNFIIDNGIIQVEFNKSDGMIKSITKNGTTTVPFQQNFYFYDAMKGYNYNAETRASGAYIFRPTKQVPKPISLTANITEYKGTHIFEIRQQFLPWLSQVVRLYKGVEDIEFEWLIGPIPIVDWTGIEIVTKYTTNLASNSTFYTDSNGRRWIKRIRNYRKYWNLTNVEPVSSNYYPLTTSICLKDNEKQLTIITDRPEGGTSMNDGELEIMLHRRLLYDDNKGVSEPLDETAFGEGLVARGKHTIQLNSLNSAVDAHRFKVVESVFHPIQMFAKTTNKLSEWTQQYNKNVSLLSSELPSNVQILTFERWRENQVLLRLEHLFQSNENSKNAQSVTLNIKELFSFLEVTDVEELTLGANLKKKDEKRLKWNYYGQLPSNATKTEQGDPSKLVLEPMQIRTLLLSVKKSST